MTDEQCQRLIEEKSQASQAEACKTQEVKGKAI